MNRVFELLHEREYSTALIYGFFAFISLVIAFVLFNFVKSTGTLNVKILDYVDGGSLTGGIAGFFLTLVFLVTNYNRVQKTLVHSISGTVYDAQGRPASDVRVVVEGVNSSYKTDIHGYFSVDARDLKDIGLKQYQITASDLNSIGKVTLLKQDVSRPVHIELKAINPN